MRYPERLTAGKDPAISRVFASRARRNALCDVQSTKLTIREVDQGVEKTLWETARSKCTRRRSLNYVERAVAPDVLQAHRGGSPKRAFQHPSLIKRNRVTVRGHRKDVVVNRTQ